MPIGQEVDRSLNLCGVRTDVGELVMSRIIRHRDPGQPAKRRRNRAICQRVTASFGENVVVLVPLVIPSWVTWLIASWVACGSPPMSV